MKRNHKIPMRQRLSHSVGAVWRGIKSVPCILAALTCTGVSIWFNGNFAVQFGPALVALAIASDVLKSAAGPAFNAAMSSREYFRAVIAVAVLVLTFGLSVLAGFGRTMLARETVSDTRLEQIKTYDRAEAQHKRLSVELSGIGDVRSLDAIEAARSTFKIPMKVWRGSKGCTDVTLETTKKVCQPLFELNYERAKASRKAEIDAKLAKLQPVLDQGRPANADPQAAAIAKLAGVEQDTVRIAISVLIVALVELGSIGGWILAIGTRTKRRTVQPSENKPSGNHPTPPKPRKFRPRLVKPDVSPDNLRSDKDRTLADVQALLASGRTFRTQGDMADYLQVPTSSFADWLNEWQAAGLIVRQRDGRRVVVRAA